jgi:hypothetical protein
MFSLIPLPSFSWTFGLMAYLYEPGPVQSALSGAQPYITTSTGVYFIVPVMSFSILVGLALDYDIFLMSRVVEFRRLGWCAARRPPPARSRGYGQHWSQNRG